MIRESKQQSPADVAQFAAIEDRTRCRRRGVSRRRSLLFATRQALAKFVARYKICKKILGVNGSIIEGG
jgi:hypothetical protein